jgi:hypothetical protein
VIVGEPKSIVVASADGSATVNAAANATTNATMDVRRFM